MAAAIDQMDVRRVCCKLDWRNSLPRCHPSTQTESSVCLQSHLNGMQECVREIWQLGAGGDEPCLIHSPASSRYPDWFACSRTNEHVCGCWPATQGVDCLLPKYPAVLPRVHLVWSSANDQPRCEKCLLYSPLARPTGRRFFFFLFLFLLFFFFFCARGFFVRNSYLNYFCWSDLTAKRIREHITNPDSNRLLIFPGMDGVGRKYHR